MVIQGESKMAQISINNGNTLVDVSELSEEEVAYVLASGLLDQDVADASSGHDDRAWLEDYAGKHATKYGSAFIYG